MILFPAIDLKDGACVRLERGDMARATVFHRDPAAQARAFAAHGFEYLHVVDLDGAFAGKPVNVVAVERILEAVAIPVIGIGAGPHVDGQILVTPDLLGLFTRFRPRFVRRYKEFANDVGDAVRAYCRDVQSGAFPSADESY